MRGDASTTRKIGDIAGARRRKSTRTRKIVLAPQTELDTLDPELIDDFLDRVFGVKGALVTDWSRLSDFVSFGKDPQESRQTVAKVRAEYGIDVDIHDRLFDVLAQIVPRN